MKKNILSCIFFVLLCINLFAQQEVTLVEIETASAHYLSVYNLDRTLYSVSDISSVNLSELTNGMYYLVITTEEKTVSWKIVKQ